MKINTTGSALRAVLMLAAKNDIRYYLNGVLIEAAANETRIVGTNGHQLGVHRTLTENDVPVGEKVSFVVPRATIERIKPIADQAMDGAYFTVQGDLYTVSHHDISVRFTPVEGLFPDYRRVVPETPTGEPGHFSAEYIATFHKLGAALLRRKGVHGQPIIEQSGEKAARLTFSGCPDFVGVLMPMRADPPADVSWARN